jgi:hypothetical protein
VPFVGRDRELAVLGEGLRRALAGERAVVLVTGEPGIGKTQLFERLAADARAAGAAVAWGRMWEVGLTPAFGPWMQILAALETKDDRAPVLASLDERADAGIRLARFAEVVAFVVRRAAERPVALLLDDVHVADPSSLQLVEYAVPQLAGHRVLVALAARDEAVGDAALVLARIQRGARRLPLARLGADDVKALVGDRADSARVFELSEGNPLFVEELVASAEGEGVLRLPQLSSVRAIIRERVARLPEATRTAVVAASLLGREFSARVLADVIGAEPLLQPLVGMVAMTAPDRYKFSHALVAEAIADEIEPSERARLHLRAARALETHDAGDASAIAHHLLAAGHLAAEAAVAAAERAARAASAQLAFEDAAALLERALALAPADPRRRIELMCAQAEALQHATQHTRAAPILDRAAHMARDVGDDHLLARTALVRGLEFRFGLTDPVLVDALREALARLGTTGPVALRARLMARLAAAEQPAPDPLQPVARALEAIELASSLGPRDRLDVGYIATAALVDYLEPARLDPILAQTLELAAGVDRWISVHTRLRMCYTAMERLDRQAFARCADHFADEARALGLPRWTRQIDMLAAMTALLDGRFADADAAAARAAAPGVDWIVGVHRVFAEAVRTEPVSDFARAMAGQYAHGRATVKAWLAHRDGDLEACRTAVAQLRSVPVDHDLGALTADAIAFAGEREHAAHTYEEILPRKGRIALGSMVGSAVLDLFDRLLLVLAAAAGKTDVIARHAEDALAVAAKLGSPVWTARVRADWAAAGGPKELWALALADAERIGMPGLVARCRAALGERPAPTPTSDRVELERSGGLWIVRGFGEEIHVKDSRGMQMLARLIAEPGREIHVLDLAGGGEAVDGGDAGEVLDARAKEQYKQRLAELVAERDRAEEWGDAGRAERASEEIEALTSELERAFGLGGRERRTGGAAERARSNTQRRITHALEQVRASSRRIGEHLSAYIKTGTYCVYNLT